MNTNENKNAVNLDISFEDSPIKADSKSVYTICKEIKKVNLNISFDETDWEPVKIVDKFIDPLLSPHQKSKGIENIFFNKTFIFQIHNIASYKN